MNNILQTGVHRKLAWYKIVNSSVLVKDTPPEVTALALTTNFEALAERAQDAAVTHRQALQVLRTFGGVSHSRIRSLHNSYYAQISSPIHYGVAARMQRAQVAVVTNLQACSEPPNTHPICPAGAGPPETLSCLIFLFFVTLRSV